MGLAGIRGCFAWVLEALGSIIVMKVFRIVPATLVSKNRQLTKSNGSGFPNSLLLVSLCARNVCFSEEKRNEFIRTATCGAAI